MNVRNINVRNINVNKVTSLILNMSIKYEY